MKTSPYVPFYPSDFLVGTMFMSAEEVGAYMRLLCFQWQQGGIPQEEEKLSRIAGLPLRKLALVLTKFEVDADGLLKNRRMEMERVKVESFRDRQAEKGKKGGRPRKPEDSPGKPGEKPGVIPGLSPEKAGKSQSETETESSLPPNPLGGMDGVREGEDVEGSVAVETVDPGLTGGVVEEPLDQGKVLTPVIIAVPGADQAQALIPGEVPLPVPVPPPAPVAVPTRVPGWQPTEAQIQVAGWFNRRPGTVWSKREVRAWRAVPQEEEDLVILNWFFTESGCGYLRRDLLTLLNNWRGEVDRARSFGSQGEGVR